MYIYIMVNNILYFNCICQIIINKGKSSLQRKLGNQEIRNQGREKVYNFNFIVTRRSGNLLIIIVQAMLMRINNRPLFRFTRSSCAVERIFFQLLRRFKNQINAQPKKKNISRQIKVRSSSYLEGSHFVRNALSCSHFFPFLVKYAATSKRQTPSL